MYFVTVVFLLQAVSILCSNILGVFIFPSISHQSVFQSISKELSLKGHNVTVVTPNPLNNPTLTNLTEISISFTYDFLKQTKIQKLLSKDGNIFQNYDATIRFIDVVVEAELNSTGFKELIADQSRHFDLILVEFFHPIMYALGGRFKAPVVGVSAFGLISVNDKIVGNPTHPVLYPDLLFGFYNIESSVWNKIKSVLWSVYSEYYHHVIWVPRQHRVAKKYFGEDLSYLGDLETGQSMFFLNVNPLLYPARPNVPAIVEMGQMHMKPVQPLPQASTQY